MPRLKPWYQVITPREDLRAGKPLDASEFAVHLDHVRAGRAPEDYQQPARFFERTYLTRTLRDLAIQVARRLAGERVETSAVFNMATQFGGGKTHALTLLYHLAAGGPEASAWRGVSGLLADARVAAIPRAATATFVGTEFDSLAGRGGDDGTPRRRTPWGEIAWQLGREEAFAIVAHHDAEGIAPAGDVIRAFLPDGPTLILMDELMNYLSRNRRSGLAGQFYNFLQNLGEEARARDNLVLAVSIPASELEMNAEDQRDYESVKKLLDRLGKAVIMAAETESAEIIRRRLFEWGGLPDDGGRVAAEYADWAIEHHQSLAAGDVDALRERFRAAYPFHPAVLSVFERKWQSLPRFQRTRGVLRLLALWISRAYETGYRGAHRDALITLGTAPLDDPYFRAALFEQLGTDQLEGPVTTDIAGKSDAHALRLDREANEAIKAARLHRKVATTVFFESNGGMTRAEATLPEVRFAVGDPDLDLANVETALEALVDTCYYLSSERNRYRYSVHPNLNKILTDRKASIQRSAVDERIVGEVQTVFETGGSKLARVYFPQGSNQIADRAVLTLVVVAPGLGHGEPATTKLVETVVREHGTASRTFKSALIFAVPDGVSSLAAEARNVLAWEDVSDDAETLQRLDESQSRQLATGRAKAIRDLKEAVWRAYKWVVLLGKDNQLKEIDLGLVHSSAATSLADLIVNRLRQDDEITDAVGPHKLARYWPPAITAWSTRAARDAFYSSPALPRLLHPDAIRRTIADGVAAKILAYVGKDGEGNYQPFHFGNALAEGDVEISDEMYLLTAEEARKHIEPPHLARLEIAPAVDIISTTGVTGGSSTGSGDPGDRCLTPPESESPLVSTLRWQGAVPPQKWMNFYTKVLSRFARSSGLTLRVAFEVTSDADLTDARIEETRTALRELGLGEGLEQS